jgi:hypothetical protein
MEKAIIPISVKNIDKTAFTSVPEKALNDYNEWKKYNSMRTFCLDK